MEFQKCLIDSDAMLKKCKEKFKTGLLTSAEEFKKSVTYLEGEFQLRGPYSAKTHVTDALSAAQGTHPSSKLVNKFVLPKQSVTIKILYEEG